MDIKHSIPLTRGEFPLEEMGIFVEEENKVLDISSFIFYCNSDIIVQEKVEVLSLRTNQTDLSDH